MQEIETLISLEPSHELIVSCYLPTQPGLPALTTAFDQRVDELRHLHDPDRLGELDAAVGQIRGYLEHDLDEATRGVAAFARGGSQPFFLARQFEVPVSTHVSASTVPDVYHLVELKDSYDRYIVLIASSHSVRILEVNLGAVTRDLWAARPELRVRVDEEWAHAHYQHHRHARGDRFHDDKLRLLAKLMAAGGHSHLIVAGVPALITPILERLPAHLRARLVDVVEMSANAPADQVVASTLARFIAAEQQESRDAAAELVRALWHDGLAVAGTHQSVDALWRGCADVLVLSREYPPGPAWVCRACDWVEAAAQPPGTCPACEADGPIASERKEALVWLAERREVEIEIVVQAPELLRVGGVGCLLRYRLDDAELDG